MKSQRPALGVLAALLLALPAAAAPTEPETTRATMADILGQIAFLLPLSLDDSRFGAPDNRDAVLAALRRLAEDGARLQRHGSPGDAGFDFLSRSLARDTSEALARYEQGKTAEARFLLHEVTDNCVACHSRLPDDLARPLGERLFEARVLAELPLDERVRLEVATRQWDSALASYEALFAAPDASPPDLDLTGYLDGYLEVALRVKRDPARARASLEKLAARGDVPPPLARNLSAWVASLRSLERRDPQEPPLAEARSLLAAAEQGSHGPDDRRGLVYYVAASSVLHQFVSQPGASAQDLGEAYYLLGLIESRVGRSFWLSQTEYFLEASIRVAPAQPSAERAYDLLEEFVVSGYTGSAGRDVPEDVQQRLEDLRGLIDAQTADPRSDAAS